MSAYAYALSTMRVQLTDLPQRRSVLQLARLMDWLWRPVYQQIAWQLALRPGVRGSIWRMIHVREWQKSSAQNALLWLLATLVIYKLVSRLGYGVVINVSVSLSLDCFSYLINRLWVWRKRQIGFWHNGVRNLAVWGLTAALNVLLAWLIISRVGVMPGRALMGFYGLVMNPVMFRVRDRIVFAEYDLREIATARYRLEMCKAVAAGHMMLRAARM